jgi:Holliday junction resolvase-like predicted endonuclease
MKNFNELNKEELSKLKEEQIDAYIDIELASKGIIQKNNVIIDYPDYVQEVSQCPERDMTIYTIDDYNFADMESAQKLKNVLDGLHILHKNYDYSVGSEFDYITDRKESVSPISIRKIYSKPKYESIKNQLIEIKKQKEEIKKQNADINKDVIDYQAIEDVKLQIRSRVRGAIEFFQSAKHYANNFEKYLLVTDDKEMAIKTIFTVFNIQDEDMKQQVRIEVDDIMKKNGENIF